MREEQFPPQPVLLRFVIPAPAGIQEVVTTS
jgi:hypothetical protein